MTSVEFAEGWPETVALLACDEAGGIGLNGSLPWRLPEDLARFKRMTLGFPVIMGRKTFLSLPKPLPGRQNVVLTKGNLTFAGAEAAASPSEALQMCSGYERVSVIGGAGVYGAFARMIDRYEVTLVPGNHGCDVSVDLPRLLEGFRISGRECGAGGLVFTTYRRIAPGNPPD